MGSWLLVRMRETEFQRRLTAVMLGKLLGLGAIFGVMVLVGSMFLTPASAADTPPLAPYVSPINTAWTLIAAFLVFFMQAGFMCLEAGFARSKESVNIILEGIV